MKFGKVIALAVIGLMIVSGFFLLIPSRQSEKPIIARALTGNTYTWVADTITSASTAGAWSPSGPPSTGDIVIFNSVHKGACTWDLAVTLGTFTEGTGYGNYINYTADFGCSDLTIQSGWFRGDTTHRVSVSGTISQSGGTISDDRLVTTMSGTGKYFNMTGSPTILNLTVTGSVTVKSSINYVYCDKVCVLAGGTLALATGNTLQVLTYVAGSSYANAGTISGPGTLEYTIQNTAPTITAGMVNAPLQIRMLSSSSGNRIVTMGANWNLGSTLYVYSQHGTYYATLLGNGFNLNVAGAVTLGANGKFTQGTGTWTFGSYIQSGSACLWLQQGPIFTGDVNLTAGTLQGDRYHFFTCSGNFIKWGARFYQDMLSIHMTGTNKQLRWADNNGDNVYDLWISGSTIMNGITGINVDHSVLVDSGAVLNITTVINLSWRTYSFQNSSWTNNGLITGNGWNRFIFQNVSAKTIWNNGTDTCGMISIRLLSSATTNCTAIMGAGSHHFATTVMVYADDSDFTMILNVNAMGSTLTSSHFKIGPWGKLVGYTGIQLTSANYHVWMNTTTYNPSTVFANDVAALFTVQTDVPAELTTYSITGLNPAYGYKVFVNGTQIAAVISGSDISFQLAGNATIEVVVWYPSNISPLISLILTVLMLGIAIKPAMMIVKITRQKRNIDVTDVIDMSVYIIVGLVLWGALYLIVS